jgi:hypothetical protein
VTASASRARGNAGGEDVNFSNTKVEAGNTLSLQSGGNTTLRGAVARGRQVIADILGDHNIEKRRNVCRIDQAAQGRITGQSITPEARALAAQIRELQRDQGFAVSHNLMQVQIPQQLQTGRVAATLRPWPPAP